MKEACKLEIMVTYRLDKVVKGGLDKSDVFCEDVVNGVRVDFGNLASNYSSRNERHTCKCCFLLIVDKENECLLLS